MHTRRVILLVAGLFVGAARDMPARAEGAVTEWTVEADRLGDGGANWHTLAIMHMAMHDAIETIAGRYQRWYPDDANHAVRVLGSPSELSIEAALASAASEVLLGLHPDARGEISALLRSALARVPTGPGKEGGIALGASIGRAVLARRQDDGYRRIHPFIGSTEPGRWRPAPPHNEGSNTTDALPFLFARRDWSSKRPPPVEGSAALSRDIIESNALGSADSSIRTPAQTEAAEFWAYQSSQRGFVLLAVRLLDANATLDIPDRARSMSLLASAMADAAILTWAEKELYSFWRPITVLRHGTPGFPPKPGWLPLIDTPPHPEYPSGHAADCFTGAGMLMQLFNSSGPIEYVAQSALPTGETAEVGMGQHAQPGGLHTMSRRFPSLEAAADECSESRIWAGAHFRSADAESHRLAAAIISRARQALPTLRGDPDTILNR